MNRFESIHIPIKTQLEKGEIYGIGLDIDDSLADTNVYYFHLIMKKFGHPKTDDPNELIRMHRYVRCVPEWQKPEIEEEVERYIYSDVISCLIPVMDGSQENVAEISGIMPVVCYITGRPYSVRKSSYDWIRNHAFPDSEIIFQPEKKELEEMGFKNGNEWRANLLEFLHPYLEGIVDDNEELINYLNDYQGKIYLSGKGEKSEKRNVIHCSDWKAVLQEVTGELYESN